MTNIQVVPYNRFSASARQLNRMFGFRRRRPPTHIINWGCSDLRNPTYNRSMNVHIAINKIDCLGVLEGAGVPHVEYTTSRQEAETWNVRNVVFARSRVTGRSGQGIQVIQPGEMLPDARFYTKYFKAKYEFRVHVAFGEVIRVQQKKKLDGVERSYVRNFDNGYRYSTNLSIPSPDIISSVSIEAIRSLGLDFGAVDILYMASNNTARVLEVNTAPGIEGDTLVDYYNAFMKEIA